MTESGYWKPVAWDGLSLAVPADWEPCCVGDGYLMFESGVAPVLEAKWWPHENSRSVDAGLKRLEKSAGVDPVPVPDPWARSLRRLLDGGCFRAFAWRRDGACGHGVIFFDPRMQRVVVLQQHFRNGEDRNGTDPFPEILARLGSARENGRTRWAIYDMDAWIPSGFTRIGHQFSPGRFRLVFSCKRDQISLLRMGPAATLLKRQSMADIAADQCRAPFADISVRDEDAVVEWRTVVSGRIRRVTGLPERIQVGRMWHAADANRILAAWVDAGPEAPDMLDAVCRRYRVLPEKSDPA